LTESRLHSLDARVDHGTLEAQCMPLEPQHDIGAAGSRRMMHGPDAGRAGDHIRISRKNGDKIIADPAIALNTITHSQATFTTRDLAQFAFRHSYGEDQFDSVMASMRGSPELVALGKDGRDQEQFTSREMIAVEEQLGFSAAMLATIERHGVADRTTRRDTAVAT
jgi:hypothetical protein